MACSKQNVPIFLIWVVNFDKDWVIDGIYGESVNKIVRVINNETEIWDYSLFKCPYSSFKLRFNLFSVLKNKMP